MIEADWLACTDPTVMVYYLRGRASDRKLRLFACAYCRLQWDLLADKRSRKAIEVAERYADGLAGQSERESASAEALTAASEAAEASGGASQTSPPALAAYAATAAWYTVYYPAHVAAITTCDADATEWYAENRIEMPHPVLLREIFGNPFRPVIPNRGWLAPSALDLAQAIYAERCFDRMPMLADALEAVGCANRDILDHCRQLSAHFKGCWAIDLLLGKS